MKQEKSCGAIVINDKNQVLLIKHNIGHTSFPKGHMELNETEEQTAFREVLEETGIEVEIDSSIKETITYRPEPTIIKDVVFFKAKPINETLKPQLEEVSEVKFVDIDEALNLITYEDDKQVLIKIIGRDNNEY